MGRGGIAQVYAPSGLRLNEKSDVQKTSAKGPFRAAAGRVSQSGTGLRPGLSGRCALSLFEKLANRFCNINGDSFDVACTVENSEPVFEFL